MDLEGIILSEMSQTQKDKYHMIPLTWEIKNISLKEAEGSMVPASGWGGGKGELLSSGSKVSITQGK